MKKFALEIDGVKDDKVCYTDTDSLYKEKTTGKSLEHKSFVGEELGRGENNFGDGVKLSAVFVAPKVKYCLTTNGYRIINGQKNI